MVKKLFFTLLVMSAFSCAHAQNTLQTPESSFFSFKMPGLPASWLSCVPGYMSVLKGTVSHWYERFSQTASQIKIADHKELIVGACAAGVVSYMAYLAVAQYTHSYWQNEYSRLVQEYSNEAAEFDDLINGIQQAYKKICDCIINNVDLNNNRLFNCTQIDGTCEDYTLTVEDFISAVSIIRYDGNVQTHAEYIVTNFMSKKEIDEAKNWVSEFQKLSEAFLNRNNQLIIKYQSQFENCEKYLVGNTHNFFTHRFSKYLEPLKQQVQKLELDIGDGSSVFINELNDLKEQLNYLQRLLW